MIKFSSVLLQDEEINQQSQLVENLNEQMLSLEEVTQYFGGICTLAQQIIANTL